MLDLNDEIQTVAKELLNTKKCKNCGGLCSNGSVFTAAQKTLNKKR